MQRWCLATISGLHALMKNILLLMACWVQMMHICCARAKPNGQLLANRHIWDHHVPRSSSQSET